MNKFILTLSLTLLFFQLIKPTTLNANNAKINFKDYKKVSLKRVILEALSSSNKLKAEKEKLLIQSNIDYNNVNNSYLPVVGFQIDTKHTNSKTVEDKTKGIRENSTSREDKFKLLLEQLLYSGGSIEYKIKAQKAKLQISKMQYEMTVNDVITVAIKAYFELLFNHEKVVLANKNMTKLKKILSISQVKYDSGAINVGDLSAIKATVANSQTALNDLQSDLADSIDYYIYVLNDNFKHTKPYQKSFNLTLDSYKDLKDEILIKNLALMNHRLVILSKKHTLKRYKSLFKPEVHLEVAVDHLFQQDNFIDEQDSLSAKVVYRQNLYNQNKDVNKIIKTHSSIKEKEYLYKEDIKKITWDASRLYNTIKTLGKSLKSSKEEIRSLNKMVGIYWDGFQLGEQDMQVLLQGHRQLMDAELQLLGFKENYLISVFTVLDQTNKLASYFDIDPFSTSFVDYSSVASIIKPIKFESKNKQNINLKKNSYLDHVKRYSYDDIVNFKDKFLIAKNNSYTVVISDFNNNYDAYKYIKSNNLYKSAFAYDSIKKNGTLNQKNLNKNVQIRTYIARGIYKNKKEAKHAILKMKNKKYKFVVHKTSYVKKLYSAYISGLQTNVSPYIIKNVPKKVFQTDIEFKNEFLKADENAYSINISSLSNIKQAERLITDQNITHNSLVFKYGRNGEWVKVMYGLFDTYSQALDALNNKSEIKNKYHPIIEKIKLKQDLYKKYKNHNEVEILQTFNELANENEIKIETNKGDINIDKNDKSLSLDKLIKTLETNSSKSNN